MKHDDLLLCTFSNPHCMIFCIVQKLQKRLAGFDKIEPASQGEVKFYLTAKKYSHDKKRTKKPPKNQSKLQDSRSFLTAFLSDSYQAEVEILSFFLSSYYNLSAQIASARGAPSLLIQVSGPVLMPTGRFSIYF